MAKPFTYQDIERFPYAPFCVDVEFRSLEWSVRNAVEKDGLILQPDFQRAHVWTTRQRIAYVEYILRNGKANNVLQFNCPGYTGGVSKEAGPYELIDGLQRLTSALMFLRNELPVFGHKRSEIGGVLRMVGFKWQVFELATRADVLKYYLDLNGGGTPHKASELKRVRALYEAELQK